MGGTPEETKARVRGYYAESTELYVKNWGGSTGALHFGLDDGTCKTRDESLLASNKYLADRAGVARGTRVLDAGCGVGGSSIWLVLHRDANVLGISISPVQVAMARERADAAGVSDRVRFEEMDFAATSLAPGSFDVVWNLDSMCHSFDKQAYLQHVYELLRPGGRFVSLDIVSLPGGDAAITRAMCDSWSIPSLVSVDEATAFLRHAGFIDVESEDMLEQARRPILAMKALAENASRMLAIEKTMTGSGSAGYEAHVRGALACAEGVANGSFGYAYVGGRRRAVAPSGSSM